MQQDREPRTDVVGLSGSGLPPSRPAPSAPQPTAVVGLDGPSTGLRAGDDDRKHVLDALQAHYVAGRLNSLELEERVERALAARTFGELDVLTADLPSLQAPPPPTPPTAERESRRERRHRERHARRDSSRHGTSPKSARSRFAAHLTSYVLVMALLVVIWLFTSPEHSPFWPIWPMLGWGIGLAAHGLSLLRRRLSGNEVDGTDYV